MLNVTGVGVIAADICGHDNSPGEASGCPVFLFNRQQRRCWHWLFPGPLTAFTTSHATGLSGTWQAQSGRT